MVANSLEDIERWRIKQNESEGSDEENFDDGIQTYVNQGTRNENLGTIKRNVADQKEEGEEVDLGSCRTIVLVENENPQCQDQ